MSSRKLGLLPFLALEQPSEKKKFFQAGNVSNVYSGTTNIRFSTKVIRTKVVSVMLAELFLINIIFHNFDPKRNS